MSNLTKQTLFFSFIIYFILLGSDVGFAQDRSTKIIKIKEVTVTARRRVEDQAIVKSVMDSVQMAQSATGSLSELITKSTPAFVKTYGQGSMATISFRGTGASHTQVLWNGININNPMLGQVDFSQIPVSFADKIELYHGGSSLHNSSGALGGAISIETLPKWNEKYHGSVAQDLGSYGRYQTLISAGVGNRKVQFKVRYMYHRANNDFEYINTAVPPFEKAKQTNADFEKHAIAFDLFYNAGKSNFLTLSAWYHNSDRNLPTIMSYEGLGRKENDYSQDTRVVVKWAKYWKNIRSELSSGYSRTDMDYLLSNKTYYDWVTNISSRSYTNSVYNKYNVTWDISPKSVLKVNVNLDYHDVYTLNRNTNEGYSNDRLEVGLVASFHHNFNKYIGGYVLLREELTDGKFSPIMPSVGIASNPLNNDKLYLAINGTRNYHKPTLNDLYWQPGGNPDLRHEEGYSVDMSGEYVEKWGDFFMKLNASVYFSWIDDWIIWQPSEFTYWTAQNIQKVFSRGIEVKAELKYSIKGVDMILNGNYSFTRTTNQSNDIIDLDSYGKQLIYVPLHKTNLLFSARYKNFYLDFMWSFTGERYATSSNEMSAHMLPYYSLCDLTVGKKIYFKRTEKLALDIQFKICNLLNEDYQAILYRAMPGINYNILIKLEF